MQKPDKTENMFVRRDCLTKEELIGYARGTLTGKRKHNVEKHLLDCELCSDAMEGVMLLKDPAYLEDINNELIRKIGTGKLVQPSNKTGWYLAAAALVSVFLISGLYLLFIKDAGTNNENVAILKKEEIRPEPAATVLGVSTDSIVSQKNVIENNSDNLPKATNSLSVAKQIATTTNLNAAQVSDVTKKDYSPGATSSDKPAAASDATGAVAYEATREEESMNEKNVPAQPAVETTDWKYDRSAVEYKEATKAKKSSDETVVLSKVSTVDIEKNRSIANSVELKNAGIRNLENNNYREALSDLKLALKQQPDDVEAIYYTGVTNYKMQENKKALTYFDQVMNHPDRKLYEDARWYKVLTYVEMNDNGNARLLINKIIEEKSSYTERAQDLLEVIGKK